MVFGFGRKKLTTFKDRVTEFWEWYPTVAERYFRMIEAGKCGDLTKEVRKRCDLLLGELSWVFGPGEDGGHSFTVSGEGQIAQQLLADYWASRAPQIPHWTFHGSRQPASEDSLSSIEIAVGGERPVDARGFLLKTSVDEQNERVDLVAWHPALRQVPEDHHMQILFLLLDEALGEFGTQTWIGSVKVEAMPSGTETTTLDQLPAFLRRMGDYYQWKKLSPLEAYTVYQIPEGFDEDRPKRLFGSTCIPDLVAELIENNGSLNDNPLEGSGAELIYVAIDASVFRTGQEVAFRGEIEDQLARALTAELSGRTLGGAFGPEESCIDVLLFDGDNSRHIIQQRLNHLRLLPKCRLVNFS